MVLIASMLISGTAWAQGARETGREASRPVDKKEQPQQPQEPKQQPKPDGVSALTETLTETVTEKRSEDLVVAGAVSILIGSLIALPAGKTYQACWVIHIA